MAASCALKPTVTNKQGEQVESKLFNDLLNTSSNDREFTKETYYVGTHESFIDTYADQIQFDENNEPTLDSLNKIMNLNIEDVKIISMLNKEIGKGIKDYNTAISIATGFNNSNRFKDNYIAVISPVENGKTLLRIEKRTPATEANFEENIANKVFFDEVKSAIQKAGGDIAFIDTRYSKYDTENAIKAENGLTTLVYLGIQSKDLNNDIAEEAGHMALGALGNHPLAVRLEKLCNNLEVAKEILGDAYNELENTNNPREIAGQAIAQYIQNKAYKNNSLKSLLERVKNAFMRIFYTIKGDQVKAYRIKAQQIAFKIAKGFMQGDQIFSVDNINFEDSEVLYSANLSFIEKKFKEIRKHIHELAIESENLDTSSYKKWKKIEKAIGENRINVGGSNIFMENMASEGIAEALEYFIHTLPDMIDLLEDLDPTQTQLAILNSKTLRELRSYYNHMNSVLSIADALLQEINKESNDRIESINADEKNINKIRIIHSKFKSLIGLSEATLQCKERDFFAESLKQIYGDKFIDEAKKKLFRDAALFDAEVLIKDEFGEDNFNIYHILEHLQSDDYQVEAWITSMADSADIVNQLMYKFKSNAIQVADKDTLKVWDQLETIKKKAKALKVDESKLLERIKTKDGKGYKLTGNYISQKKWGAWEEAFQDMKSKERKQWLLDNKDLIKKRSKLDNDIAWDDYFKHKFKDWHRENSIYNETTGKFEPYSYMEDESQEYLTKTKIDYTNYDYDNLSIDEKTILKEITTIKEGLDNMLTYINRRGELIETCRTHKNRMPQFRGSIINRTQNLMNEGKGILKSLTQSFRLTLMSRFIEDSQDRDFGDLTTMNDFDPDDWTTLKSDFEANKITRIQVYGINKLSSEELSTDIYAGLLQYAAMATSYRATQLIADIMEVGKEVLSRRKDKKGNTELENIKNNKGSRVYKRYLAFLNAQVYNIYAPRDIKYGKVILTKLINFLNGLASKLFLGGNLHGALANVGTGYIEIFKEAATGQFFDIKDWHNANKIYLAEAWKNVMPWQVGRDVKNKRTIDYMLGINNKLHYFDRMFNVQNNFETLVSEYNTRRPAVFKVDYLFAPYKAGDHYMQNISFLAVAQRYKFIDGDGNIYNLWDAYELVERKKDDDGNLLVDKDGNLIGGQELRLKRYTVENPITGELEEKSLLYIDPLTGEHREWKDGSNKDQDNNDVVEYMNFCREINIRMHGIYNKLDKTMFHNNIWGHFFLTMKGYALGLLERRFGRRKFNISLSTDIEGSVNTVYKVLKKSIVDIFYNEKAGLTKTEAQKQFLRNIAMIFLPFNKRTAKAMKDMGFSESQYYNLRRNSMDGIAITILMILTLLTAKGEDDDDEEDDYTMGLIHYYSNRLFWEQAAFNYPPAMKKEAESLLHFLPPSLAMSGTIIDTGLKYFEEYDRAQGGFEKYDNKGWARTQSFIPYWRSLGKPGSVGQDPYAAKESYDYGKSGGYSK